MDCYVGTKIVLAESMDECAFRAAFKGEDVSNRETRSGYKVVYEDGYTSWSPKEAFERAYRPLTMAERGLAAAGIPMIGAPVGMRAYMPGA